MTRFISFFKFFLFAFILSNANKIQAQTLTDILEQHSNPVFIELNIGVTNGIKHAIAAGYNQIYVAYASQYVYENDQSQYGNNSNVQMFLGDPLTAFNQILMATNQRATILLDANNNPLLLAELQQLNNSSIKNHTIVIDDIDMLNHVQIQEVKNVINNINSKYDIVFEHINHLNRNALVAKIGRHH